MSSILYRAGPLESPADGGVAPATEAAARLATTLTGANGPEEAVRWQPVTARLDTPTGGAPVADLLEEVLLHPRCLGPDAAHRIAVTAAGDAGDLRHALAEARHARQGAAAPGTAGTGPGSPVGVCGPADMASHVMSLLPLIPAEGPGRTATWGPGRCGGGACTDAGPPAPLTPTPARLAAQ